MADWVRIYAGTPRAQSGHSKCLDAFNATIASGIETGDCGDPRCCFSSRYDRDASERARAERLAPAAMRAE